jgi:predicted nucleotidyltransferase component of viral defense system
MALRLHLEDPVLFREAIRFTAAETGFSQRLIEKDYFCSVALEYLVESDGTLTFKGGTCLAKIHGGFYRLSEDLDFSISTAFEATRGQRRHSVNALRTAVAALPDRLPGFRIEDALRGANENTQYNATAAYESLMDGHVERVSIEVGVREPNMTDPVQGESKTVLLNPINGRALVAIYPVRALSYSETMAEKLRAALCRREVAIRDFFDVDHAVRNSGLNTVAPDFIDLLDRKIAVPGTGPIDVSPARMEQLQRQLEAQLRPVLREQEFAQFDLARAIDTIRAAERELAGRR